MNIFTGLCNQIYLFTMYVMYKHAHVYVNYSPAVRRFLCLLFRVMRLPLLSNFNPPGIYTFDPPKKVTVNSWLMLGVTCVTKDNSSFVTRFRLETVR